MWNDTKSILLSQICVVFFMVLLAAVAALAPWFVARALIFLNTNGSLAHFLVTIYCGFVPAALLLVSLLSLLNRLARGAVFITKNVACLRHISWYCFIGAAICAASVSYYYAWGFVAVAAAFMGLIVRVVKNVFSRAVALQDDADHTI